MSEETVEIEIPQETHTFLQAEGAEPLAQINHACGQQGCGFTGTADEVTKHLDEIHPKREKHPGGRPCNLCQHLEEFQNKLQDYIDDCRGKKGNKPKVPYLMEFADMIDVDKETIIDWSNKLIPETKELEHTEFHRLIKVCENLQELRCNQRLMGRYNPTGAIFLLKTKHKYIETEKQIHAGDANEPLEIRIIEERAIPDGQ